MRPIIYRLLRESLLGQEGWGDEETIDDHLHAAGSVDAEDLPPFPFAVIHMGVRNPGIGAAWDGSCTIWIHDKPADYDRIDRAVGAVYGTLNGAEHVSEEDGSAELISSNWTATSGDLFDPGFRTITKNSSYRLIGRGA